GASGGGGRGYGDGHVPDRRVVDDVLAGGLDDSRPGSAAGIDERDGAGRERLFHKANFALDDRLLLATTRQADQGEATDDEGEKECGTSKTHRNARSQKRSGKNGFTYLRRRCQ